MGTRYGLYTGRDFLIDASKKIDAVVAGGKLYRRSCAKFRFPVGKLHEDEFTTYRVVYPLEKVAYLDYGFYFYRQREGSITSQRGRRFQDALEALTKQISFYEKRQDPDLLEIAMMRKASIYQSLYEVSETEKRDAAFKVYRKYCKSIFPHLRTGKAKLKLRIKSMSRLSLQIIIMMRRVVKWKGKF